MLPFIIGFFLGGLAMLLIVSLCTAASDRQ